MKAHGTAQQASTRRMHSGCFVKVSFCGSLIGTMGAIGVICDSI